MVNLYLDAADLASIRKYANDERIRGVTTNPSLMKKSGLSGNYEEYAKYVLGLLGLHQCVSFEVITDELPEMERQARIISSWGNNVYVKIPALNTKGDTTCWLVRKLLQDGIKVNITAVMTYDQIAEFTEDAHPCQFILSIFAGRIADTSRNPTHYIRYAHSCMGTNQLNAVNGKVLWASAREVWNIQEAAHYGADIITLTPELIDKYTKLHNKSLLEYSLETVEMFYNDAKGIEL